MEENMFNTPRNSAVCFISVGISHEKLERLCRCFLRLICIEDAASLDKTAEKMLFYATDSEENSKMTLIC